MIIYRVEDCQGKGPYFTGNPNLGYFNIHNTFAVLDNHPNPDRDGLEGYSYLLSDVNRYKFGFATPEQYCEWFDEEDTRNILIENSLKLSIYEIHDFFVYFGNRQVIFKTDMATKIDEKDLEEFYQQHKYIEHALEHA